MALKCEKEEPATMRRLYEKSILLIVLLLMSSVIVFFLFYKPHDIISETGVIRCYVIEKKVQSERPTSLGFVTCKNGAVIRFDDLKELQGVRAGTLYNFVVKIDIENGNKSYIELE